MEEKIPEDGQDYVIKIKENAKIIIVRKKKIFSQMM